MSDAARLRAIAAAAAAAAQRWSLPAVDGPVIGGRRSGEPADGDPGGRAWQAEHARGYEAGMAAARAEMQAKNSELDARLQRLERLLQQLAQPLRELDDSVQEQLVLLTLAIGKQLVRRELKADPAQVIAIIREAVGRLPIAAREVRVHLHPEDAAVVRERLAAPTAERAWSIVEDPGLTRGGCLVRTDSSQIDARLESRIQALASAILGDERAAARGAEASVAGNTP
jgi:flagellar assembly protein FliH